MTRRAAAHRLPFRPPFDWQRTVAFLAARRIGNVECVDARSYLRSVRWDAAVGMPATCGAHARTGWLRVCAAPEGAALDVELSASLEPAAGALLRHLRAIFDLDLESSLPLAALPRGTPMRGPMRLVGTFDGFELAVRAIVGQQISVKAARTLIGRLVEQHGEALRDAPDGVARVFPTASAIAALDDAAIAAFGLNARRARTIRLLAEAIAEGSLVLAPGAAVEPTVERLLATPGIGDWTAQYIAMRALCWRDAFPAGDLAVMRALGARTPARAREIARDWRPWRAYAVMNLWSSLGAGGVCRGDAP
ncbi:MAG: 3-methyladenine DNA glycosylase 2 [Burkholderiaceae bacterium]|nr:3-methyladenine DNA glycosylase 2 [Burkholderiaceae bacterium]